MQLNFSKKNPNVLSWKKDRFLKNATDFSLNFFTIFLSNGFQVAFRLPNHFSIPALSHPQHKLHQNQKLLQNLIKYLIWSICIKYFSNITKCRLLNGKVWTIKPLHIIRITYGKLFFYAVDTMLTQKFHWMLINSIFWNFLCVWVKSYRLETLD